MMKVLRNLNINTMVAGALVCCALLVSVLAVLRFTTNEMVDDSISTLNQINVQQLNEVSRAAVLLNRARIQLVLQHDGARLERLYLGGFLHHSERENGSGQHQQHFGKSLFLLDVQLIGLHVVTVRYRNRNWLKDNCASNLSLQEGP